MVDFPYRKALNEGQARRIWLVLVEHAGASAGMWEEFRQSVTTPSDFGHEFRFQGLLGFGGKLYFSDQPGAYVHCYSEDLDEVRAEIIKLVNQKLARLVPTREALVLQASTT